MTTSSPISAHMNHSVCTSCVRRYQMPTPSRAIASTQRMMAMTRRVDADFFASAVAVQPSPSRTRFSASSRTSAFGLVFGAGASAASTTFLPLRLLRSAM